MRNIVTVLMAASLSCAFTTVPALSQQYSQSSSGSIKINSLEKVRPYMARPQIEILDESPIVKDRRTVEENPTYEIVIPPLQGRGGGGQGRTGGGGPNVIRLTPTGPGGQVLAKPGFESNIGSLKAPAKQLPVGTSTGVHAKADLPGKAGQASPMQGSRPTGGAPAQSQGGTTLKYKEQPVVGGSSQGFKKVTTNVNAERLPPKRGDLIHGK